MFCLIFQVVNDDCLLYTIWPNPFSKNAYGVFVFCITFLVPLIILIICYGKIVWVLTRRIDSNLSGVKNDKFELARTNTIKTLLIVALCFVICWSSNQIYYLMYNLGFDVNWNSPFYKSTVVMAFLNCTINPFIYLAKYQDFQSAWNHFVDVENQRMVEIQSWVVVPFPLHKYRAQQGKSSKKWKTSESEKCRLQWSLL